MEVAPFFVDFHHFLSIFTIYALLSRFTFCRDLRTFFLAKIAFSATLHVFCMYDIIHCSVTSMFSKWSRIAVGCWMERNARLVLQLGPLSLSGFVVAQFWSLYLELLAACNRNFGPALTFCWAIPSKKVHHLRAIPFAAKCWKVLRRCISGQVTLKCISWGGVVWPGAFEILALIKMGGGVDPC